MYKKTYRPCDVIVSLEEHMKIFIDGSKMVSCIDENVRKRLNEFINSKHEIIIGDGWGIDASVQEYLYENNYPNVVVYTSGNKVRNNIGDFKVCNIPVGNKKGFEFYRQKDIAMAKVADCGFMVWDGKSRGTLANIIDLANQKKFAEVYLTINGSFHEIKADKYARDMAIKELGEVSCDVYEDIAAALK